MVNFFKRYFIQIVSISALAIILILINLPLTQKEGSTDQPTEIVYPHTQLTKSQKEEIHKLLANHGYGENALLEISIRMDMNGIQLSLYFGEKDKYSYPRISKRANHLPDLSMEELEKMIGSLILDYELLFKNEYPNPNQDYIKKDIPNLTKKDSPESF